MKNLVVVSLIILLFVCHDTYAITPTETLKVTVDKLIIIAGEAAKSDQAKKNDLTEIISQELDFEAVSRRVVSKYWKKATVEEEKQFKDLFLSIVVNTYFSLLKEYSNEKVLYLKEQLKKKKYAIVDTQIISNNKKIPVRYRMINTNNKWKIYDFVPEGISLVTTYRNNYKSILQKQGVSGLLKEMQSKEDDSKTEK